MRLLLLCYSEVIRGSALPRGGNAMNDKHERRDQKIKKRGEKTRSNRKNLELMIKSQENSRSGRTQPKRSRKARRP